MDRGSLCRIFGNTSSITSTNKTVLTRPRPRLIKTDFSFVGMRPENGMELFKGNFNNWKFYPLNNETELDDPLELSVQERMNLQLKSYSNLMILTGIFTLVILALAVYCTIFYLENISDLVEPVEGLHNVFYTLFGCIMLASGGCFAWLLKNGRKEYKENESINREYTQQAYLIALSVYGREGDACLDFYDIARDVFPELKKADIESVKETGEVLRVEELTLEDKKKGDYTFDLVSDKQGWGTRFVIKCFEKKK